MSLMPVLWIVWAGVTAALLALLAYRGTITRYEEDQLFLDEASSDHQQKEQTEVLTKISNIQPYVRLAMGATCALSAGILGIYVWDAARHLM